MLRSEAARYARWSAIVALVLASLTALAYFRRNWVRHLEKKNAPPAAPVDVSRQSAGINFKKVEQNRTIFEVAASKSTEFKGHDANLLEDVRITIYGKTGERHDVMHTRSCEYARENGGILCSGEIQIELMTAGDWQRTANDAAAAKAVATEIQTRGVTFDRGSGLARTDQKVTFAFPNGTGEAVGLEYRSEEGTVRLLHDVEFKLKQASPSAGKIKPVSLAAAPEPLKLQELHVKGTSLDFARDSHLLRLAGPAQAETEAERLTAAEIRLSLDNQFHAQTMVALGSGASRPTMSSTANREQVQLQADTMTAHFSPQGAVIGVDASGAVHGMRESAIEQQQADADTAKLELWPWLGRPKELNLSGNVLLQTREKQGESRLLRTASLRMQFSRGESGQSSKVEKAETLAPGTMEWTDTPVQAGGSATKTKLAGDRLALEFAASGKPQQLYAVGNVQTERAVAGKSPQKATARTGAVHLLAGGGWSEMNLDGDVRLSEGERSAQAGHAVFMREAQTATLTGNATARDAATETRAPKIVFTQNTGEIRAEGGVHSTDFASRGGAVQLAPVPANISSDKLQANSKTGRALYSGHARLWQGDSVLEAESIELLREMRALHATGKVRAVFPQTPSPHAANPTSRASQQAAPPLTSAGLAASSNGKAHLCHVSAETLTYSDKESRAHLEHNVTVQSAEQKMRAPLLDLYFQRSGQTGGGANTSGITPNGSQQISRAVGAGGVVVEEGSRKATAEGGEYIAADGKFVMSGGNPTIYDGTAGTTTGRQLTFFLADDTIIVDSENGSRTLTKHRVEK